MINFYNDPGIIPPGLTVHTQKINIVAVSGSLPFTIIPDIDGIVDTLVFVVERINEPDGLEKRSN